MFTAALFTVPHTGTHFIIDYMTLLDMPQSSRDGFIHLHTPQKIISNWNSGIWATIANTPCIITARDPYLTAIRYIHDDHPVSQIIDHWVSFLDALPHLNSFVLDIGCRPENRLQHLIDAAIFLGRDPIEYADKIQIYANKWTARNVSNNKIKHNYLQMGMLPNTQNRSSKLLGSNTHIKTQDVINWSLLDPAVAWYRSLPTNDY